MVQFRYIWAVFVFLVLFSLNSCVNNVGNKALNKPIAISKSNDLVVVADESLWKGEVGDTFRYYFESAFPITPNPEPIFKIRYFSFKDIDAQPLRRQLRNYIVLANIQDTSSFVTKMLIKDLGADRINKIKSEDGFNIIYGKDKWARDQLVVYVVGKDKDDLNAAIKRNFSTITQRIQQHDEEQIKMATYFSGYNGIMNVRASKTLGINIKFPKDYVQALFKEDEKLLWGRRDSKKAVSNIVLQSLEYKDTSQFNEQYLKRLINGFGKYVSSDSKKSKLVVNDKDLPLIRYDRIINGNQAIELRGIWEMTDDFMGGAFVSYLIKDKESNNLAFIFEFVYAPGREKKEYLQQMMIVANTLYFEKK